MGCKAYRKIQAGNFDYEVAGGTAYFAKYAVLFEDGSAAVLPGFHDGCRRYKPVGGIPVVVVAHDLNLAVRDRVEKIALEGSQRVYVAWKGHETSDPILGFEGDIMNLINAFEYGVSGSNIYDIRLRDGRLTGLQNFEAGTACFVLNETTCRWQVADMMP